MPKISKHEFAGKQIKSISHKNGVLMIDLGKGPFDVREYLQLDDKYRLNVPQAMQDRIDANGFDYLFIQDVRTYGPDVNIPSVRGVRVLKRTTVSIPLAYEAKAPESDEGLLFTYYK